MFGCFCFGMGTWALFIVKKTRGKTLEKLDILFSAVNAEQRAQDVEAVLHSKKHVMHVEGDESLEHKTAVKVEDSAVAPRHELKQWMGTFMIDLTFAYFACLLDPDRWTMIE